MEPCVLVVPHIQFGIKDEAFARSFELALLPGTWLAGTFRAMDRCLIMAGRVLSDAWDGIRTQLRSSAVGRSRK